MTEPGQQCCGNCWRWSPYSSGEGGCCRLEWSSTLASEWCLQWERGRYKDGDQDDHDEEEADDDA